MDLSADIFHFPTGEELVSHPDSMHIQDGATLLTEILCFTNDIGNRCFRSIEFVKSPHNTKLALRYLTRIASTVLMRYFTITGPAGEQGDCIYHSSQKYRCNIVLYGLTHRTMFFDTWCVRWEKR